MPLPTDATSLDPIPLLVENASAGQPSPAPSGGAGTAWKNNNDLAKGAKLLRTFLIAVWGAVGDLVTLIGAASNPSAGTIRARLNLLEAGPPPDATLGSNPFSAGPFAAGSSTTVTAGKAHFSARLIASAGADSMTITNNTKNTNVTLTGSGGAKAFAVDAGDALTYAAAAGNSGPVTVVGA